MSKKNKSDLPLPKRRMSKDSPAMFGGVIPAGVQFDDPYNRNDGHLPVKILPLQIRFGRVVYRSAITGKFVTKEFAEKHPNETIRQVIK